MLLHAPCVATRTRSPHLETRHLVVTRPVRANPMTPLTALLITTRRAANTDDAHQCAQPHMEALLHRAVFTETHRTHPHNPCRSQAFLDHGTPPTLATASGSHAGLPLLSYRVPVFEVPTNVHTILKCSQIYFVKEHGLSIVVVR